MDYLNSVLINLSSDKYPLAFFGDNIDNLYRPDAESNCIDVFIVREICQIGKSACSFGFISGLSANAYKKPEDIGFPKDLFSEYPDLNNTVYREYQLE